MNPGFIAVLLVVNTVVSLGIGYWIGRTVYKPFDDFHRGEKDE